MCHLKSESGRISGRIFGFTGFRISGFSKSRIPDTRISGFWPHPAGFKSGYRISGTTLPCTYVLRFTYCYSRDIYICIYYIPLGVNVWGKKLECGKTRKNYFDVICLYTLVIKRVTAYKVRNYAKTKYYELNKNEVMHLSDTLLK